MLLYIVYLILYTKEAALHWININNGLIYEFYFVIA